MTNDDKAAECVAAFKPLADAAQKAIDSKQPPALRLYRDGTAWCVTMPDFVNLQESPAGFGGSIGEAVGNLMQQVHTENANAREAARSAEHRLEYENYYQQPRNLQARDKASEDYQRCDKIADAARGRARLLRQIIDGVTVSAQIEAELNGSESLNPRGR